MKLIYMTIAISVSLCILMSPCTSAGRSRKTKRTTTTTTPKPNDICNAADHFHYQQSTQQCFKLFLSPTKINWDGGSTLCTDNKLVMAHPQGPAGLGRLLEFFSGNTGVAPDAWLNCKYENDKEVYVWQDDNSTLPPSSQYWRSGQPSVTNGGCLVMDGLKEHSDTPYTSRSCSTEINQVICEKKLSGHCHTCITSGISLKDVIGISRPINIRPNHQGPVGHQPYIHTAVSPLQYHPYVAKVENQPYAYTAVSPVEYQTDAYISAHGK